MLQLAAQPPVGSGYAANFILRKMSKKQASSVRSLQTRLEVLRTLVTSHELLAPGTGVTTETLVSYWYEKSARRCGATAVFFTLISSGLFLQR
jgi:hypothetical protein